MRYRKRLCGDDAAGRDAAWSNAAWSNAAWFDAAWSDVALSDAAWYSGFAIIRPIWGSESCSSAPDVGRDTGGVMAGA